MKRALTILFPTFLTFLIASIFIINIEKEAPIADKVEKISGAYEALNLFGMSRTYPNAEIPAQAHFAAWESLKSEGATTREEETLPWETMGPKNHGGRTLEIAFNPQNLNTMYIGSASGGLWRSYTQGVGPAAWEYVSTGFPVLGVSSIAFAPQDSMVIYIGTGEVYNVAASGTGAAYRSTRGSYGMGILKTEDGGQSWEKSLDWSYNQNEGIWDIKVAAGNPNKVVAATTDGVYQSLDGGGSWTQIHDVVMANSILIHPDDDNTMVVGCGNQSSAGFGVYKTTDNGVSWTKIISQLPQNFNGKVQLELAPSDPDIIYASIGNGLSTSTGATWLCRSEDFGTTWTLQNTLDYSIFQGWFAHDVAVSPNDPDHIICVGIEVWRSIDGGLTLQDISSGGIGDDTPPLEGPDGSPNFVHSDCHDVIYHPFDPNKIWIASDGGLHHSDNDGDTYASRNGGYQSVQFYNGFSNSNQDSVFCIGGLQDNGTIHWEGGVIWTRVFGGDGSWAAINPADDNIVYVSWQNLNIQKSTNHAQNFFSVVPPSNNENTMFIAPYVIASDNPEILYSGRSRIYKSTDGANNWEATNNGNMLDGNPILSLAISPENSNVVYAATGPLTLFGGDRGHVFVTLNGGNSWTDITQNIPDRFPMDMTVDPTNESIAYITMSGFGTGHVFKTEDYGGTWEDISLDLPDVPTNAVIVDPLFPDNIYVGNDLGVFASVDGGLNWETYHEGLFDAVMVFDLKISPTNRKLRAATHGNGVFQRDLLEDNVNVGTINPLAEDLKFKVFPNPVNTHATAQYHLKESGKVIAQLVDHQGRVVQSLLNEQQNYGVQEMYLNANNLSSGNYYLQLITEQGRLTEKIVVIK
jgi:photosystem II stability/assembly factor-like uncharacterized protein